MKKRIVCVTGCRSEYDILYPVLRKIEKDSAFEVLLIVSGAHLSERFGHTVQEIEKDGFKIAGRICNLIDSDERSGKAKGSGILMIGLSDLLDRLNPDFVMVVGDREEAIVSATVSAYLGIPLVHLCGGDRTFAATGDVDEAIRHATSKLASIHFTMNEEHRRRLLKMGEEPWRVINSGNPALDRFRDIPAMSRKEVLKYFNFDAKESSKPLLFVLHHVISSEVEHGSEQMRNILEVVASVDAHCVVNYPNSDMGSRSIIRQAERYKKYNNIRITKNIPRKEFVNLLRNIDFLIGNSSMALLEGGFLKVPAINVGQRNRERMNGGNVVFTGTGTEEIRVVVDKILSDRVFYNKLKRCRSLYGNGRSAGKIVSELKKMGKTRTMLLAKDITY